MQSEHYEILQKIAEESKVNDTFWEVFQWHSIRDGAWIDFYSLEGLFDRIHNFVPVRRKPNLITLSIKVPE